MGAASLPPQLLGLSEMLQGFYDTFGQSSRAEQEFAPKSEMEKVTPAELSEPAERDVAEGARNTGGFMTNANSSLMATLEQANNMKLKDLREMLQQKEKAPMTGSKIQ